MAGKIDLTTEDGAHSAAQMGAFFCFAAAGAALLGLGMAALELPDNQSLPIAMLAQCGVEMAILITAGVRLYAGKGVLWGSVAAAALAVDILIRLIFMIYPRMIMFDALAMIAVVAIGVRGAVALRRDRFDHDAGAVFD
jgi:hypothetical protein